MVKSSRKSNGEGIEVTSNISRIQRMLENGPKDVVPLYGMKLVNGEYKRISANFNETKFKKVELMMITDVQFGAYACKVDRLIEFRSWILAQPHRFVVFGGDMIDAATPLSIASPYENKFEPSEQVFQFCEIMMPMRHRVLGYVGGNHEERTARGFGAAGSLISGLLQIPYSRGMQMIDIHIGEHNPFKVSLWHGTGGARTKGAKAQMLHRFMGQGDSQLYLCGHLHDVVLLFDWRQERVKDGIHLEKIAGVMSSSFMDFWGTYAERAGLPASDTMMALATIESDGHWGISLR